MRISSLLLLCIPVISTSISHAAGIQIGRTRIIYEAGKKEIALPLVNKDRSLPWLVQSWTDTGDGKTRGPFIVTPLYFVWIRKKSRAFVLHGMALRCLIIKNPYST